MRKYQTFNASCAYAGIANLLIDYEIDVEDRDIIIESNAAYQLLYNEKENRFIAGYKIQGKHWFNYYLNRYNLKFTEIECTIGDYIFSLDSFYQKHMIGFYIRSFEKHVVIYEGIENKKYKYLNNKKIDSSDDDFLLFTKMDLYNKSKDFVKFGYLEKTDCSSDKFDKNYFKTTINNIDNYLNILVKNFDIRKSQEIHSKERDLIYRTLFLDIQSMVKILGFLHLSEKIKIMRTKYSNALKSLDHFALSDLISFSDIQECMYQYKNIVLDRYAKI